MRVYSIFSSKIIKQSMWNDLKKSHKYLRFLLAIFKKKKTYEKLNKNNEKIISRNKNIVL